MTEIQMPRSPGTGLGPNMLPPVSWFEFVLNENLLEEHLSKDNPGMAFSGSLKTSKRQLMRLSTFVCTTITTNVVTRHNCYYFFSNV